MSPKSGERRCLADRVAFLAEQRKRLPVVTGRECIMTLAAQIRAQAVQRASLTEPAARRTKIQGKSLLGRGLNALAATISTPLLRPAGSLASLAYGKARGVTIRRDLFAVTCGPPAAAA